MDINLYCPINQLGYGIASLNITKSLSNRGNDVFLHPIGNVEVPAEDKDLIVSKIKASLDYNRHATCLKIWHQNDLKTMIGKGQHIGFPFFELDKFNETEVSSLQHLDKIFVTCEWAKEILENNNVIVPTYITPLGVDRNLFNENLSFKEIFPSHKTATKFLAIGKWEVRKGHDVLLDIFCDTFKPEDDVMLIMNCFNPFIGPKGNQEWTDMYLNSPMKEKIAIINTRLQNQKNVAELIMNSDCGLFLSRAEGWNLELLEMMSCGKYVIATNNTAHSAFANNKNAMLTTLKIKESAYDGVFFKNQGNWATFEKQNFDEISQHMLNVHKKKQSGKLDINLAGIETAKFLSWDRTCENIERAINA